MVSIRRMVLWRLIPLLISAVTVRGKSQLDSNGFLSIDCGLSENTSYVDEYNLTYVSDEKFIDTGNISSISSDYVKNYSREYLTVRYFSNPNEPRNCYTLGSLNKTTRYLIRGGFYYGNYDNKNKPPTFDIYVGVDLWNTVNASSLFISEIIVKALTNSLEVCLVNTNQGTPYISWLHLRQFSTDLYTYADSITSLVLVQRDNFGASIPVVRYPDDKYDRWWYNNDPCNRACSEVSTNTTISYIEPYFDAPPLVLQTAVTTTSTNEPLNITWRSGNTSTRYYYILHFYEIQDTSKTGSRKFYIYDNGNNYSSPPRSNASSPYADTTRYVTDYYVSLVALNTSALPPLMNAFELYTIAYLKYPTYDQDVVAINSIKEHYGIKKGWIGDPCLPSQYLWTNIDCTYPDHDYAWITSLNLASSSLTGPLIDSFGNLTALENLNLSSNDLSGNLTSLASLTALKFLDIRGNNNISTTLPTELSKKEKAGSLQYWSGPLSPSPTPTPPSPTSSKKNFIIVIAVVVPLLIIAVVIAFFLGLKRRNYNRSITPKPNESFGSNIPQSGDPNFGNRKFSYNDLKKITNDFKNNIGTGGYGSVYLGLLENGVQVAVKMLSQSSSQGVKEFLAEAENLARVHHKNLVSLMGYCIDRSCMTLVYEYMQEGNLQDKLKDHERPLDWKQRLRIAYESALGLEYLHKACNPPLIHRDVKTSNILLSANLEAKIADFGLSRAFDNDASSHVSTRIVGTPGYLDPEYYLSNQLSAKSDVFSFGVVLLEIITGRPPTNAGVEEGNLVQWVHQKLSRGDIKSIIDPRMEDKYDINSVWKVTDLACKCTEFTSSERPPMAGVAAELKESLDLEMSMEEIHIKSTENLVTDVSQDSNFERTSMGSMPAPGPGVR